jgi:hypothetical protein
MNIEELLKSSRDEQAETASEDLAKLLATFRDSFVKQGFSREMAEQMCLKLLTIELEISG